MPQQRPEIARVKGEEARQVSKWEHLAKFSISRYLQSCLTGDRKQFFSRFAPYSTQWQVVTDKTWAGENPLDQAVQIARFFEGVNEAPPQILLRTSGYTSRSQNLGTFSVGGPNPHEVGTQRVASIETTVVPVGMAIAALNEDQCHDLTHFIEQATGPMCRFLINYYLVPEDESHRNWTVTLPLTWNVSEAVNVPIGEDRKQQLWTATYSAEVSVEVATWAQYSTPFTARALEVGPSTGSTTIDIPSQVSVGSATPLRVTRRPGDARWKVNDLRLARITVNEALFAKRVGTVTVSLISEMNPGNDPYASQEVQIVP